MQKVHFMNGTGIEGQWNEKVTRNQSKPKAS